MTIKGYIDHVDIDVVGGWVLNEEDSSSNQVVDIYCDEVYLGSSPVDIDAPDLKQAGLSSSAKRFKFLHPKRMPEESLKQIKAKVSGSDHTLDGGYDLFLEYCRSKFNIEETLMPYCACLSATAVPIGDIGQYALTASGDIRIEGDQFSSIEIKPRISSFASAEFDLDTFGRARSFWFYPETEKLGFHLSATVAPPVDDLITIEVSFTDQGKSITMPIAVIPVGERARECQSAMPEPAMIKRIIGPARDPWMSYVIGGWTNAAQLNWMCEKYLGKGLKDMSAILDWGSGCARNTKPIKYFAGTETKVVGVDIDPVNIDWSKRHISNVEFNVSNMLPPLSFEDNTFDIIYGLSIFTHLTELAQDMWLEELCRVLKPGGIAFLTFHGEAAAYSRGFSARDIDNYIFRGIEDYILDDALVEVIDKKNYYRSTFHTTKYLKERWSQYFDILGIEGTTGGYQWCAVCRKPSEEK